jgi:C1A family cysteine protease
LEHFMKTWIVFVLFLFAGLSEAAVHNYAVVKGKKREFHTGLIHKDKHLKGLGETHVRLTDCAELPESFDLRTLNTVSPVRDQGNCGSCWAFSKTQSLESAVLANGGSAVDLSEQELVACDDNNYGCDGGDLSGDSEYQVKHGQGLETDFPYKSGSSGSDGRCKQIASAAKGTQFVHVGAADRSPTENELKCALYKSHTVPWITVSASDSWSNPPGSEKTIYNHCGRGTTNHAVGVVGWFKKDGKTAFIMKNSWSDDWGDKGYMSLPLGCDSFGDEVAYIMTDAMPCKPPVVKLPAEVQAYSGVEVVLGVKAVQGVTYSWFVGDTKVGDSATLFVTPTAETIYKLVAKTACGESESSVRVALVL